MGSPTKADDLNRREVSSYAPIEGVCRGQWIIRERDESLCPRGQPTRTAIWKPAKGVGSPGKVAGSHRSDGRRQTHVDKTTT